MVGAGPNRGEHLLLGHGRSDGAGGVCRPRVAGENEARAPLVVVQVRLRS